MILTRKECEASILEKLDEIKEIYLQYNPNGDYLSCTLFCKDEYAYVDNASNEEKPIDAWTIKGEVCIYDDQRSV